MPPVDRAWPSITEGEAAVATIAAFITALPEVTPAFNEGWIGGPCTTDADCDYDGGVCETPSGGTSFCSLPCSLDSPYCPDRTGNAATFCIDLGSRGGCVAQCDTADAMCLDGQICIETSRFGRSDVRTVCR